VEQGPHGAHGALARVWPWSASAISATSLRVTWRRCW
jgi:hypothetical protein